VPAEIHLPAEAGRDSLCAMQDERTRFVVILRTGQLVQFDWAISALEGAEIPVLTAEESVSGLTTAPVFPSTGPGTFWSVSVPEDLVERAKEVLADLPGEVTTQPDVWDFRPKRGVKLGWKILIVGYLALLALAVLLLILWRGGPGRETRGLPRGGPRAADWGNKRDPARWYADANRFMDRSNYAWAILSFGAALKSDPQGSPESRVKGLSGRAYCYARLHDHTNAILDLREALMLAPTNTGLLISLAFSEARLGRLDDAMESYNRILQADSNHVDAIRGRGHVFWGKSQWDAAIGEFNRALALNPRDAKSLRSVGYCQVRTNKLEEAVASYTLAIELEPQSALGFDGRGYAYQKMGKWELAALDYQQALVVDPGFGSAHFGLAEFYFEKGIYLEAWDQVKKSQKAGTQVPGEFLLKLMATMPEPAASAPWAGPKK
jgi:tetratricopeptide (TPR) repeat protein